MKISRIILLILVPIIWGYVIITYWHPSKPKVNSNDLENTHTESKVTEHTETSDLIIDYTDPFLKKKTNTNKKKINTTTIKTNKSNKNKYDKKVISWPCIAYKGCIKNNNSNRTIAIVSVENHSFYSEQGDSAGSIVIQHIWEDSVKAVYNAETKIIVKK
jgi:hypothetical protein